MFESESQLLIGININYTKNQKLYITDKRIISSYCLFKE